MAGVRFRAPVSTCASKGCMRFTTRRGGDHLKTGLQLRGALAQWVWRLHPKEC